MNHSQILRQTGCAGSILLICCTLGSSALAQTPVTFTDVSKKAGIADARGIAFSVSWVDFNNDGRPDIWLSRHNYSKNYKLPSLFINKGNGTFEDIGSTVWPWTNTDLPFCLKGTRHCIDAHGSSWIDYDNDGDQDLFIPVGDEGSTGQNPSLFLVNNNGKLVDQAAATGLADPPQRGRASLWYDWNNDGLLDAYVLAKPRTDSIVAHSQLFENHLTHFDPVSDHAGLHDEDTPSQYAQLGDVTGDGHPDVIVYRDAWSSNPLRVYDTSSVPYADITASFPQIPDVRDAAIADLNNDLHPDIFMLRNHAVWHTGSWAYQQSNKLAGFFLTANSGEVGFRVKTPGDLTLSIKDCCDTPLNINNIKIGGAGRHPASYSFTVSPSDDFSCGIASHEPGSAEGYYIGYDRTTQTWTVLLSSSPQHSMFRSWVRAETSQPFTELTKLGNGFGHPSAYTPVLLMYNAATGSYENRTEAAGLAAPIFGNSVAAADFNNDGLVDLFIDGGDPLKKTRNTLYLNRGGGKFLEQATAGGAAGETVGPHNTSNALELGSKVAVADFNRDGFIDVLTTNTLWESQGNVFQPVTPNRLFRNLPNGNHWVELDLRGTRSNRNGIGARVLVTAGGNTQLREQQGGMHAFAQDSQRIHFGLSKATKIDQIEVDWPSGVTQVVTNLTAVDRAYVIREP